MKLWIVSELGHKYLTDFVRRPLLLEDLDQEAVATELKLWQKEPHLVDHVAVEVFLVSESLSEDVDGDYLELGLL